MSRSGWCVALVLMVAVGCKKHDGDGGGGSGSDQAKPHHAGMCPSTVAHSTTTDSMDGSNVLVTIASDDNEAVAAVQKRADELLAGRVAHRVDATTQHLQNGEHGGATGMCPVYVPEGATATATHTATGVVVAISAQDPAALKSEIDARIQRAADFVKTTIPAGEKGTGGGLGGGKNDEGMNHSGRGDGKGIERRRGDGHGGGGGTGGGGQNGAGGGSGSGSSSAAP